MRSTDLAKQEITSVAVRDHVTVPEIFISFCFPN
jgi:hypothetical protein